MSSLPRILHAYLGDFVGRRRRLALVRAGGVALAFGLVWMVIWCIVDRVLPLAGPVRLGLLVIGLGVMGAVMLRPLRAALSRRIDWSAAAAQVEARHPAFAERLQTVTSRLVGPEAYRGSPQLVEQLLAEVEKEAQRDDPRRLVDGRWAVGPWIGVGAVVIALVVLMGVSWLDLPRLMARFAAPLASIAPATTTRITSSHDPEQVIQGDPLVFRATAEHLDDRGLRLHLSTDGSYFSTRPMAADGDGFVYRLNAVDRDVQYRISGGDAVTPLRTVRVLRRPTVLEYRVRYDYPAYIDRQPLTVTSPDGTIEAPVDSRATLTIRSSEPLADATPIVGDRKIATEASADPQVRHATLDITGDATYQLRMVSRRGAHGEGAGSMSIRAIPDRPPIVRLIEPAGDLRLTPRDVLAVRYQAFDDYGIASLRLVAEVNGVDRLSAPLRLRGDPARQEAIVDVDLARLEVAFGDLVRVRVAAEDGRGHVTAAEPRSILVSPRSIDMNTHLRIAELREAQARTAVMLDALRLAERELRVLPDVDDAGHDMWLYVPEYDRALSIATEQAMLVRQGLLRVIVRSPSSGRSAVLAAMGDTAQHLTSTSDALMLHTAAMQRSEVVEALKQAVARAVALGEGLAELSRGEQSTAQLAELANLTALGARDPAEFSDAAAESYKRARDDFAAGVKALGLDPGGGDLQRRLEQMVDRLAQREASAGPVDYSSAARDWSTSPTSPLLRESFTMRLEAASQAEAVRPDADLVRANDLHLASRASAALTLKVGISGDPSSRENLSSYPEALAALQAAHLAQRRVQDVRLPEELAAIHQSAQRAREQMRRWAGVSSAADESPVAAAASDDAAAVMEANAATAIRDYDRAVEIDQQLAAMETNDAAAPTDSDEPAGRPGQPADRRRAQVEPVQRSMEQAERIDQIAAEQLEVARQTRDHRIDQAVELQQRQERLASAIDRIERDASAYMDESSGNTREQALAALQAAREQLAAMPQALAAVQESAAHHEVASAAYAQAVAAARGAGDGQQPAAERRVAAAEAALADARSRLEGAAAAAGSDVGEAIADQLRPYVPETHATVVAIEQELTAALRQLQQATEVPDAGAVEKSVAEARAAIRDVQLELRAAQEALSAQDPLVAARWFAQQAAADLGTRPPNFDSAEQNQQEVSAALDQAWRNTVHQAARGRMAGSRAFGSLYGLDLAIAGDGAVRMESGVSLQSAFERAWGWLRPVESAPITATGRDADPPGYQEALRAYFEALGSIADEKGR